MKKVEILISCHKETDAVRNEVLRTIEVGAALHRKDLSVDYRDDAGAQISEKNPFYCELTAQYWAWKNLDADYYGFFHYRRYLSFRKLPPDQDPYGNLLEPYISETTAEKLGLDPENIEKLTEQYDFILPEEKNIRTMPGMGDNMRSQYLATGYLHEEDLDIMMEVLREKSP